MQAILKIPGFTDNILTHILAGLGAGFFAVCIGSPLDVVTFFPFNNFCSLAVGQMLLFASYNPSYCHMPTL